MTFTLSPTRIFTVAHGANILVNLMNAEIERLKVSVK